MSKSIRHIRHELSVGDHLYRCFADARTRAEGWKRMQDARRIARRLKLNNFFA